MYYVCVVHWLCSEASKQRPLVMIAHANPGFCPFLIAQSTQDSKLYKTAVLCYSHTLFQRRRGRVPDLRQRVEFAVLAEAVGARLAEPSGERRVERFTNPDARRLT